MKIAIAGYGMEGKANYEYFRYKGEVTIADERDTIDNLPAGVPTILGAGAFGKLADFDLVVRTASLPPRNIVTNGRVWSGTNEFFAQCKVPIIGVTGSKGKGTTCSLIESILRAAGKKTMLVGNIGRPAIEVLAEANQCDVIVYEMSSFQLWDLQKSPHVAVVLMIEPDHLDVHADFDEYIDAKANIRRQQLPFDLCVYHPTNPYSARIAAACNQGTLCRYNDPGDIRSAYAQDDAFYMNKQKICSTDALQLPGAHNIENACAAMTAVWEFVNDGEVIAAGLRSFKGLDHRLKFVREVNGVQYYDDSIATTPGSAIAAMNAFDDPKVLILGGSSKGADFTEVAQVARDRNVRAVVLIGSEAPKLEQVFAESTIPVINLGLDTTMSAIVQAAQSQTQPGGLVIMSPACASFDMFKSYVDRGQQFVAAVNAL